MLNPPTDPEGLARWEREFLRPLWKGMTTPGTRERAIAKAVTYRVLGSALTFAAAYLWTRDMAVTGLIGFTECTFKLVVYYLHERLWRARC